MTKVLQIRNQAISSEKVITLLANYQMLPQFLRQVIIDQAIAAFPCTPDEKFNACQQFYQTHQITSESERQDLLNIYGMTLEELEALAMRDQKIETFKRVTWERRLESYFLSRKSSLDKVIYSLIQTTDMGVASELYFRLQAGEQAFSELAQTYSQGSEAQTGGLLGPIEVGNLSLPLAQMLYVSQPGHLLAPVRLGEWVVVARLEKLIPAQLDEAMRQRLLNELFENWLQEELVKVTSDGSLSLN